MKKYIIEITVFLCGALGMVLELVAARVLSPYVGSSNLIWTTIIGVMLTSMSIGYWLGGKLADKEPNTSRLSSLILLGAIFTSLIPILETVLVKNLSTISSNLVIVAFISSAVVFGLPSFVLATVSPYSVKLKDKDSENIGKLSGKISSYWKHFWNIFSRICANSNIWSTRNNFWDYNCANSIIYFTI